MMTWEYMVNKREFFSYLKLYNCNKASFSHYPEPQTSSEKYPEKVELLLHGLSEVGKHVMSL